MIPPRGQPTRWRTAVLTLTLLAPAAAGQGDADGASRSASATLPVSNEALLISSRVQDAIQAGDYRLAMDLSERLMALPDGLVAAPASRTAYPVWRQAFGLLGQLPEQGVELYRQLHDAEVAARFQEAVATADLGTMRVLFRGYRLSSTWPAIGVELSAHLLDQGRYGEAIEVLRECELAGVAVSPEHKAQLAVALAAGGALTPAATVLEELRSDASLIGNPEWPDRLVQLDRWFGGLGADGESSAGQRQDFSPRIEPGAVWMQTLLPDPSVAGTSEFPDIAQAVDVLRWLPQHAPVFAGEMLVVRLGGRVWALDRDTLEVRWSVAEHRPGGAVTELDPLTPERVEAEGVQLAPEVELLLSNHLRHAVSVGFGMVYTVEGSELIETEFDALGQRPFRVAGASPRRNELVARELATGRVVWRTSMEPAEPLFDVVFQNVPVAVGDALVAPIVRGKDLSVAVIDPADGHLIRDVPLVGPPTHFTDRGGGCLMATDETTVYVGTGNGVIAALSRDDLSWKWATTYPSTLAEHLGQLWWQPPRATPESNPDLPTIVADLLIVAPTDSPDVFALDRFSGRERWRMSRREYPFLIGASPAGLILGGHDVACFDLGAPIDRPPRWRSVPLQITGRAVVHDERVYVPTLDGVVVLDARTGKVLADQLGADSQAGLPDAPGARSTPATPRDRTGNLAISGDSLFSVSPARVVKYPDLARMRRRIGAIESPAGDDRAALMQSWLDALEGQYEAALARLQHGRFDEPALRVARDRLQTHALLALARTASAGDDRLSWLQRALALADSPGSVARLAVTIGRTLEEDQRWSAALHHYGELLNQIDVRPVPDAGDPDRQVASWVHAAQRIRALHAQAPPGFADELIQTALESEDGDAQRPTSLQRLRVALADESARSRLDRLLTLQQLPPELKVGYLSRDDPPDLPADLRRRLHLERWDAHVSLGRLDEARADKAAWEERFANSPAPAELAALPGACTPLSPEEELERVEAIDLAYRKLVQAGGQPFTSHVARQWTTHPAELLLDSRQPLTGVRPWILITDLNRRQIELINAFKHAYPQRQTDDGLTSSRLGRGADPSGYGRLVDGRRFEVSSDRRDTWPVVIHDDLAAIPVRGGLVCVGLGPERYAGRRLWELAVPDWDAIPTDFGDRSVAGANGVYFTPRRDRVVLVGWFDGNVWWQRDLPGVEIAGLYLAADRLVIVSDDRRVWVTDATFGGQLQPIETGTATPRRIDVVGETIIAWEGDAVTGISAATLRQTWRRASPPIDGAAEVSGRPWIAYHDAEIDSWKLLDARRGAPVFDTALGQFEGVSAVVVDADQVLIAGLVGALDEARQATTIRVSAFSVGGERLWSRDFSTQVLVNATQLAAHPDLIPILLGDTRPDRAAGTSDLPAVQLVDKRTGEIVGRVPIRGDYQPIVESNCGMYMLATPTRIIVQVGGNLIAYGNSLLRSGP